MKARFVSVASVLSRSHESRKSRTSLATTAHQSRLTSHSAARSVRVCFPESRGALPQHYCSFSSLYTAPQALRWFRRLEYHLLGSETRHVITPHIKLSRNLGRRSSSPKQTLPRIPWSRSRVDDCHHRVSEFTTLAIRTGHTLRGIRETVV